MPRPTKCRRIHFEPMILHFKPAGIPLVDLEEIVLTVEELEAIRLKDLECMSQEDAAVVMDISQPTFHRLVRSSRKKISEALVHGKAIRIDGGNYKLVEIASREFECFDCERLWSESFGTGRPQKCPDCGSKNIHRSSEGFSSGRGHGNRARKNGDGGRNI
ncbi:MAG: DUF134 domain-containing protein [Halobacteriota archaeon]|nr:DUF134 domain-containing protein [Halobacteriota archaeon]